MQLLFLFFLSFLLFFFRFPPPNTRLNQRGSQSYNARGGHTEDHNRHDHHDRHRDYRDGHRQIDQRMPEREHHTRSRHMYQYVNSNMRPKENNQCSSYKEPSNYYEDVTPESFHVNSMGDIDHRQLPLLPNPADTYNQQRMSSWSNPPPGYKKQDHDDRNQSSFRHHDSTERNKIPVVDYTGHRPPASDHYGGTSGPTTNNNDTSFSRSVDDTVDIVRKRLMNRNDPERLSQDASVLPRVSEQEASENPQQHIQQEQPAKKRTPRQQRHNAKSNCDKMKSNIVHQLFKMDKDKMHKLMDDPGSSSKFEYAISSLITESQNSLNRHLRSVAEKTLYSSSTDFIHNDNNTIYEDTFMKQMQCLLDPQDTVLLEDIKPIVMAELSKVLQLGEFEQRFDASDEHSFHLTEDRQSNYPFCESYNYNELSQETCYEQEQPSSLNYENSTRFDVTNNSNKNLNHDYDHQTPFEKTKPLFERRQSKRIDQIQERKLSIESQRKSQRRSLETPAEEPFQNTEEPLPLFDSNTDQISEDEDTFAELDRQYHVAVDHNFIENDDLSRGTSPGFQPAPPAPPQIKTEIDSQLQTLAQSSLDLFPVSSTETLRDIAKHIKQEVMLSVQENTTNETPVKTSDNGFHKVKHIDIRQEYVPQPKGTEIETEKAGSSNIIKTPPSNTRKRSIDQRPSHRKEKRKKSESSQSDSAKPTSKNVSDNANASSIKSSEKCNDAPKHYYNIFLPKDESKKETKDGKKVDSTDKSYSDKYVKRKETSKKPKEKECEPGRRRHSSTSSQTILSPKDSSNSNSQTPTKSDPKTKLKTIDMFVEQPKKASSHHHAHRNTASGVTPSKPTPEENIPKQVPTLTPARNKTLQTKHVGTQVIRRLITKETQTFQTKIMTTRFTQTDRKKFVSKFVQTLTRPLELEHSKPRSDDAFERMKEIDMEIQVLLQEKFKLYSSLESKDVCPSRMPSLGMTVLNVTPIDENKDEKDHDTMTEQDMSADQIVEDFTSIPVEELEQIALESVQEESNDSTKVETRSLRQKVLQQERMSSESPTSSKRSNKKVKPPNISLIEQIITDDRPLEDIISLDALEEPQAKSKKKPRSQPKKKTTKKTKPKKSANVNMFDIKDCSVVLIQTDVRKFIKEESFDEMDDTSLPMDTDGPSNTHTEEVVPPEPEANPAPKPRQEVEEDVVNDLQFDMLDVSEDIVIGEESEIKCNEKDLHGRVAVSEEIILDNSQASADDVATPENGPAENECKMFDYSTDEKLRRDSITVTGNADAVLAIEVSF